MEENPSLGSFARNPANYGIVSLVTACLAWASWPLVIVVGVFLVLVLEFLLVLIAVGTALVGLGAGIYYKKPLAIATAGLALLLVASGAWWVGHSLTNF